MRIARWLTVAGFCWGLAVLPGFAAPVWVPAAPMGGSLGLVRYSPSEPRVAYAVGPLGRIFRSEDNGSRWRWVGRPDVNWLLDLLVDPDDSAILYAQNPEQRFLRSVDSGATWTLLAALPGVNELVAEAHHPGALLAAAGILGVLRSVDRGETWTSVAFEGENVLSVGSDPFAEATLFVVLGRYQGRDTQSTLRSTDGGTTWSTVPLFEAPPELDVEEPHFAFDPAHPGTIYTYYRCPYYDFPSLMFRSLDGGLTWTQPSEITLRNVAVAADGTLLGTDYFGAFISRDRGESWAPVYPERQAPVDVITSVAASPTVPGTFLAAGYQGLWKSVDSGLHWRNPSRGIPVTSVGAIAIAPIGPSKIITLAGGRVFESIDRGNSWRRLHSAYSGSEPYSLTFDPRTSDRIYGPSSDSVSTSLVRSEDGGHTWRKRPFPYSSSGGSICTVDFGTFALDPSQPDTLYVAGTYFFHFVGSGSFFVRSRDGGTTWTDLKQPEDLIGLFVDPRRSSVLYGLSRRRLYKSEDEARTWKRVGRGLPYAGQRTLAIDPRDSRHLYAGTKRGVFASEDGGITFRPLGMGLEGRGVDTLLIDPLHPERIFAAGGRIGVYRYDAHENRWMPLNDGLSLLSEYDFVSLALDPREPAALYAGTYAGGLVRLDLAEIP